MPLTPRIPGVYLQQPVSSSTAITASPTGITAFVGRAVFGSVDQPGTCYSFGDYEQLYGGLAEDFPLSYAVQHFFLNGGQQALIARLFEPAPGPSDGHAKLAFPSGLSLQAATPGAWGNRLQATISTAGITDATASRFISSGVATADLFNLTITLPAHLGQPAVTERFLNLTASASGPAAGCLSRIDRVLASQSTLARVVSLSDSTPRNGAAATLTGEGNDGKPLQPGTCLGDPDWQTVTDVNRGSQANAGMYLLQKMPFFQLLCIPPDQRLHNGDKRHAPGPAQDLPLVVRQHAVQFCVDQRAIFVADPPSSWQQHFRQGNLAGIHPEDLGLSGQDADGLRIARNVAIYFPHLLMPDPLRANQICAFAPCGAVAGVIARTDSQRGVWKAPAGMDATLNGVHALAAELNEEQDAALTTLGINCLRTFPELSNVVWGARTLAGADQLQDDFKYLSVRRLVLFIESSVKLSIEWAVFEANTEDLWSSLRLSVGSFLADLSRQGAIYNYNVECGLGSSMTAQDILDGVLTLIIQIAPEQPAEFILISFQQRLAS